MPSYAQNWFIHTPIKDGEVLSSWLIRSALDIGCSPLALTEAGGVSKSMLIIF